MTSSNPSQPSSSSSSSSTTLSEYISLHPSFLEPRSPHSPLPALYSSLSRQRKSNASGYASSIEWWKTILLDVTFSGSQSDTPSPQTPVDRTVFKLDESTKAAWTVDGVGRPLGLGTVVGELERERTVVRLKTYLGSASAVAGPSGGIRQYLTVGGVASVLSTPVRWAASSVYTAVVGSSDDDDDEDETLFRAKQGEWVVFPLVVRIASTFTAHFYASNASPLSLVMSTAEFQNALSDACLAQYGWKPSPRDGEVVLRYLSRDSSPRLAVHRSGIVKLSPSADAAVEAVTDEDRSVVAVKETLRKLELQITSLESQISHRSDQISSALRAANKPQAASYLRSRKALQDVLAKRTAVKANLDQVVGKIEQAKTDVEVMRAYRASQEVLSAVLGSDELKVDNVERTMEGLHEVMDGQRAVEEAMKGDVGAEVDEDEVMDELRMLEREAEAEKEAEREKERLEREERVMEREKLEKDKQEKERQAKEARDKKEQDELQARLDRLRVAHSPPPTVPSSSTVDNKADDVAEQRKASPTAIAE